MNCRFEFGKKRIQTPIALFVDSQNRNGRLRRRNGRLRRRNGRLRRHNGRLRRRNGRLRTCNGRLRGRRRPAEEEEAAVEEEDWDGSSDAEAASFGSEQGDVQRGRD